MTLRCIKGDITKTKADAIVNAANTSLLGGGGVDGAIHRAGGPAILEACKSVRDRQGECATGEAVITTAGKLDAKYVIHTVGPVWTGDASRQDALLANAYRNSLRLASQHNVATVAFPSISTGAYRYPKHRAAEIAVHEVEKFLVGNSVVKEVIFVCFDDETLNIYQDLLKSKI